MGLDKGAIFIFLFFVLLTLSYFRYVVTAPPDTLLTNYIAEDLSWHLAHTQEKLDWLRQGFFAIGDFWVPRAGGFSAGGVELENVLTAGEIFVMLFYLISGSLTLGHHLAHMSFYLMSLIFSYWYGVTISKRRDVGIVFAIAYSFSPVTITWEKNVNLAAALFLLPLFLLFLERMMTRKNYVSSLLASLFFLLLFLDSFYVTFFASIFVVFRLLYSFITERSQIVNTIKTFGFFLAMSFILCLPFIYPILLSSLTPLSRGQYWLSFVFPNAYFDRSTTGVLLNTRFPQFAYLGFSAVILAVIPLFLIRSSGMSYGKTHLFYFISYMFFFLFTIGSFSPVNITELVHTYVPLASSVRAINVASLMVVLNLAFCAGLGYACLADLVSRRVKTNHLKLKSKVRVLIPLFIVVMVIFGDLTFGFEPTTVPNIHKNNDAYEFVRQQFGDFRIIEIPSVSGQQAMTTAYTKHDTINFIYYAYGFYGLFLDFTELWWQLARMENTGQLTSSDELAAYWRFDEGKGNSAKDESGMHNDGLIRGTTWTEGLLGFALSFDGADDFVEIPNADSLNLGTSGAIEFWVKLPREAVYQGVIIGKGGGWNRPGWLVSTLDKNHIRFQWQSGDDIILDSATALSYDEWHHVISVMNGHTMRIYIDGKLDPNLPYRSADRVNSNTTKPIRIGLSDNGLLPFKGEIDEVKIYNKLDVPSALAFYGIKYVLVNSNPDYFDTLEKYGISAHRDWFMNLTGSTEQGIKNLLPFWLTRNEVLSIESALSSLKEFEIIYSDSNFRIYENSRYVGEVFAVSPQTGGSLDFFDFQLADAKVTYSKLDLNTIEIHLENKELVLLMVSQNFREGWVATIGSENSSEPMERKSVPISEVASIQCLRINEAGSYKITLHYRYYESSLMLFLSFYALALAMAYFVVYKGALSGWKKFRKFIIGPSLLYGLALVAFSSLGYPALMSTTYGMQFSVYPFVDKYVSAIFSLGVSLIVFAGISYVTFSLTNFTFQIGLKRTLTPVYIVLIVLTILLSLSANLFSLGVGNYLAGYAFVSFILLLLLFLLNGMFESFRGNIKRLCEGLRKWIRGG